MESDYWDAKNQIKQNASKFFNTQTASEKEMMNFTKNYVMRHKLNRDLQFSEDFRNKYLTKEYGNYDKYKENKVETKYDESN